MPCLPENFLYVSNPPSLLAAMAAIQRRIEEIDLPVMWDHKPDARCNQIRVKIYVGDKTLERLVSLNAQGGNLTNTVDSLLEEARVYRNLYNQAYRATGRIGKPVR